MGLIREPKNVDFYVIDKAWTEKELKEFSKLIKQRKEQLKKAAQRKAVKTKRRITEEQRSNSK
jgi:hypothetical protein